MNYDLEPIVVHTGYTYKQMKDFQRHHIKRIRYILIMVIVL